MSNLLTNIVYKLNVYFFDVENELTDEEKEAGEQYNAYSLLFMLGGFGVVAMMMIYAIAATILTR